MLFILLLLSCLSTNSYPLHALIADTYEVFALGKPKRTGTWKLAPLVKVCKELDISQTRVQIAIAYWRNSGYEFHDILYNYDSPECYGMDYGSGIIITGGNQALPEDFLAVTRTSVRTTTGYIIRAKIFIRQKHVNRPRVLEHELGHALGWKHYPQTMHIMHPDYDKGGHKNDHLRNVN
tara:strand:+ start:1001 stop:1537 length:537 start_codon:yes stop_codon:yes gene_type:complete